jgi:hypothetical protein
MGAFIVLRDADRRRDFDCFRVVDGFLAAPDRLLDLDARRGRDFERETRFILYEFEK